MKQLVRFYFKVSPKEITQKVQRIFLMFIRRGLHSLPQGSYPRGLYEEGMRSIRSRIPPRPKAVILCYVDHYGNPMKNRQETTISLIRTRENKFYLQRIFDDGSVERWPCPGLEMMKGVTSFEHFSISDIDEYGGVTIPQGIAPSGMGGGDKPTYLDAVRILSECEPLRKFTRPERRAFHFRCMGPTSETPFKHKVHQAAQILAGSAFIMLLLNRIVSRGGKNMNPFAPSQELDVYTRRLKEFGDMHPEHGRVEHFPAVISPGQMEKAQRSVHEDWEEVTDTYTGRELLWKIQHAWTHDHWPKGMNE